MKSFVKEFMKRGAMFSVLGPIIVAIVYIFLNACGVVSEVSVIRMITEILTSALMAFIAAGISAIYTVDKIQQPVAALIQGSVLFIDYSAVYLLNGWLPFKWQSIAIFTAIFVVGFALIWLIISFSIKKTINYVNTRLDS